MSQLDQQTQAAVANAGELLIRAAAVIGTLTEQQRSSASGFVVLVALALQSAHQLSPSIADSLRRYRPEGFPLDATLQPELDDAIKRVCDTSFACGEHGVDSDEPYESLHREHERALDALKLLVNASSTNS